MVFCQLTAFGHLTSAAVVWLPILSHTVTPAWLVSRFGGTWNQDGHLTPSQQGDWGVMRAPLMLFLRWAELCPRVLTPWAGPQYPANFLGKVKGVVWKATGLDGRDQFVLCWQVVEI